MAKHKKIYVFCVSDGDYEPRQYLYDIVYSSNKRGFIGREYFDHVISPPEGYMFLTSGNGNKNWIGIR